MRIEKRLVIGASLAVGIALIATVAGYRIRQQKIRTQKQDELALLCQQKKADEQQPLVIYDAMGREIAVLEGTIHRVSGQAQRFTVYRLDENCDRVYTLYNLSGEEIATFPPSEQVRGFVLNSSRVLTLDRSEVGDRSIIYDLSGKQVTSFFGRIVHIREDIQLIVTDTAKTSYLYNLSGDEIAALPGRSPRFFDGDKQIATYDFKNQRGYLYDLSGNEVVSVKGSISDFFESSDGEGRLLTEAQAVVGVQSYLYDISGNELAAFEGIFPNIVEIEGDRYITAYDHGGSSYSTLHDLSGKLVTTFKGIEAAYNLENDRIASNRNRTSRDFGFLQYDLYLQDVSGEEIAVFEEDVKRYDFTPDGQRLVVSYEDGRTVFYDLQGGEIVTIEGTFNEYTSDGKLIISNVDSGTRLYDSMGNEIAAFDGTFSTFTAQDTQMLTYDSTKNRSYLYDLSSSRQIGVLEGEISEVSEDGKFVVTASAGEDKSYLYDQSGRLLSEYAGTIANFKDSVPFYPPSVFVAGQYLITATSDGTSYLRLLDDEESRAVSRVDD